MKIFLLLAATLAFLTTSGSLQTPDSIDRSSVQNRYLGFDRNDYPGDRNLKILRQTFAYSGYWLNNPPGAKTNSWHGKRQAIEAAGFGFLVLFNGRTYAEIKSAGDAVKLGASDASAAIKSAQAEGFPAQTIIFLDQEQGGRLLAEQRSYLHSWVDRVSSAKFQAGVYCSGIAFEESPGASVITADDIHKNAGQRRIRYWIANDSCPPSPGCTVSKKNLTPESSGISFVDVWQFAQSPRRPDFAGSCSVTYNKDGNCYPPGIDPARHLYVDLDVATEKDPSHGRTRD